MRHIVLALATLTAAQQYEAQRILQGITCAVQRQDTFASYTWISLARVHGRTLGDREKAAAWDLYLEKRLGALDAKTAACGDVPRMPGKVL